MLNAVLLTTGVLGVLLALTRIEPAQRAERERQDVERKARLDHAILDQFVR